MSVEEYEEKILYMLERTTNIDMLKKLYTVIKVLYKSQQKE